jgi:hypothetical protein
VGSGAVGRRGKWVIGERVSGSGGVGQWVVGKRASGSEGVGQWVARESGTVGRRGKWDSGPKGAAQVAGREARRRSWGATRFARGSRFPPDGSTSGCVRGKKARRGERDVRRCQPTLHGRVRSRRGGGFERGIGPRCTDGPSLEGERGVRGKRGGRGWRAKIPFHVAQKGTVFSPREPGEEAESPEETEENRLLQLLK